MNLMSIIRLFGGLALFIYGMITMGGGLERLAGAKLEKTLEKMTGNLFKALLMGITVTAIIQSSSATTVMVVGFVNAGIMSLQQCVGVILGANIGTTVTSQILRLDSSGTVSSSIVMQLLKPSNLAYIIVAAGLVVAMLAKKKKTKDLADIFIGFGILFIGMSTMELSVAPLRDVPAFQNLFIMFTNPVMGVLVGAFVTAVIQSSSASVGILQAISTTGIIPYSAAIPIIMGQNIGTCVTALLSSIGATKNARRAAMLHFYFNLLGTAVFLTVVYTIKMIVGFSFWDLPIDKGGIANFHLLFNVSASLFFIPFSRYLVWLAEKSIPEEKQEENPLAILEPRFYATPSIALDQCQKCITGMANVAKKNFSIAVSGIFSDNSNMEEEFKANESFLDRAEVEIGKYLLGLPSHLPQGSRHLHAEMLHSLSDFEKIGDYSQNIYDCVTEFRESGKTFSDTALKELKVMCDAVNETLDFTIDGYSKRLTSSAKNVLPLEDVVDNLKNILKNRHIDRLGYDKCTITTGLPFLELVHDLEKIADHCSNIAIYTIQLNDGEEKFDTHSFNIKNTAEYSEKIEFYNAKYVNNLPENI